MNDDIEKSEEVFASGDVSSSEEAQGVLELARYANVQAHKPLVEDELLFIAKYPDIAKKLLTLNPLA